MACPIGNVTSDSLLEEICFTTATALLTHGGAPDLATSPPQPVPSHGGHPNCYHEDFQTSWKREVCHYSTPLITTCDF